MAKTSQTSPIGDRAPSDTEGEIDFEALLNLLPEGCEVVSGAQQAYQHGILLASRSQRGRDGLDDFLVAYELEPDNLLYAADLALSLRDSGRGEEARQVGMRLAGDAESGRAGELGGFEFHRIGLVFSMILEDQQRALPFFAKACALEPEHVELQLAHAVSLADCGYEAEAFALAERAVLALEQSDTLSPEQAHNLARAAHLLCIADPVRAYAVAQKALQAAPDHPDVLREAGVIAIKNNDHQEAVAYLRQASRIDPDNDRAFGGLQYALFSLGLFEDAFRLGQDILGHWPEFSEVRFNLAAAALNLGWYQEAEREFFDLLSQTPDDAFAHAALGLCYAIRGRAQEAREHQRRALELDGDNPEIQRMSAEIDRLLGSGGGATPEVLRSILLTLIAAVLGRSRKGLGR